MLKIAWPDRSSNFCNGALDLKPWGDPTHSDNLETVECEQLGVSSPVLEVGSRLISACDRGRVHDWSYRDGRQEHE